MADPIITSPANPRLKPLVGLHRRRCREETGTTLVEGREELALALAAGVRPHAVYFCSALFGVGGDQGAVIERARASGAEVTELGRAAFEKVAYREGPDGLLAVVDGVARGVSDLPASSTGLALVCQAVEKPGNLGAMLRTADAAGVGAVVAADPVTDWGNPNVIRASKGTVFSVLVASGTTSETVAWVRRNAISLVVATPDTDLDYTDVDYTGPVAIAVGAEKHGADSALLDAAAYRVRIPMFGKANSLNVAASAAIVIYEAVRQRRARGTVLPP